MKNFRSLLFCMVFLWFGHEATAQMEKDKLLTFNQKRIQTSRTAMLTLGGWAVGNFLVSGLLIGRSDGSTKAFHQMNAGWNVINLGLAGFGYYSALRADPVALDLYASVKDQYGMEKPFCSMRAWMWATCWADCT